MLGVDYTPVLPFLSDPEEQFDEVIKTAKKYGADFVLVGPLILFGNKPADCKILYHKFLYKHYPELVSKYKGLFRIFLQPAKEYQKELEEKSRRLCEKYGIKNRIILRRLRGGTLRRFAPCIAFGSVI